MNIKWSFADIADASRTPFTVPKVIVNPTIDSSVTGKLSNFVSIDSINPFTLSITNGTIGTKVFDISGLAYNSFLNVLQSDAYCLPGEYFNGIMGLGERNKMSLFLRDGVYSMWNFDSPTPPETGTLPGKNVYGTHPFYMYKTDSQVWTGVFSNNANAQDWYIKNNPSTGQVSVN